MNHPPNHCEGCGERLYATVDGRKCFNCDGEDSYKQTYTLTVTHTDEQAAMEAADKLTHVCAELQSREDVQFVRANIPGPTDFQQANDP